MATPTSSYLQTLPHDDAISFIASLQKVREHLSRELQWMNQQIQQKTTQLHGIETLLSEASASDFSTSDSQSDLQSITTGIDTKTTAVKSFNTNELDSSNGNPAEMSFSHDIDSSTQATSARPLAVPAAAASNSQTTRKISKQSPPKLKPKTQPTKLSKAITTKGAAKAAPKPQVKARSIKSSPSSAATTAPKNSAKGQKLKQLRKSLHPKSPSNSPEELRNLLRPKFEGQTLKDVTAQVLQDANKPMHLNEMITEMYGSLSAADLKRAKVSLMNILSAGRNDGIWRNLGQGNYAATSVTDS